MSALSAIFPTSHPYFAQPSSARLAAPRRHGWALTVAVALLHALLGWGLLSTRAPHSLPKPLAAIAVSLLEPLADTLPQVKPDVSKPVPKLRPKQPEKAAPTPLMQAPHVPQVTPEQPVPDARSNVVPLAAAQASTATKALEASAAAPPAVPAPAALELPSADADYLNNPKPAYPPLSRRTDEQGKVLLRVYVSAAGAAEQVQLQQSSGYERLDRAALDAVKRWRFVPGKRAGVAVAMWWDVPIVFTLSQNG